ncbi:Velvet factor-like protein 1 [Elsinoe fawcettii]|nr:Velvet factor-like protein 1 [Elsinoe fawcettii]
MNYYYPGYGEQSQSSYYQLASEDYDLKIRQQPRDALLAQDGKEKSRKPIDPPPIVEVNVREAADPIRQFLQSPYLFMTCSLVPADTQYADPTLADEKGLCGSMVSSLHKLKDIDNKGMLDENPAKGPRLLTRRLVDGGFFVFGDVSVKRLGEHRLLFSLYELQKETLQVAFHRSILSDVFTVHPQKEYPGLEESTHLSRAFADQGVRLRLRKESRTMGAGSSRKRSYPYTSQPTAGPSRQATSGRSSSSYGSSQVAGSAYSQLSRSPSKRQRSEEGQYPGYQLPARPLTTHEQGGSFTNLPEPYTSPGAVPRMGGAQSAQRSNRWSYMGGPTSTPGSSDFTFRSSSLPRLDPSLTSAQGAGMLPQGTVQQGQAGSSTINPANTSFQQQPFSYGNVPVSGGYQQSFPQGQYRSDSGYPSQSGMYPSDQYGDPSQGGYSGSFDNNGRSGYSGGGGSSGRWQ